MTDTRKKPLGAPLTRRSFLQRAGIGGAAVALGGTPWKGALAAATPQGRPASFPLEHVIISCQENRSFDHYYGYSAEAQAAHQGPPADYTQPDANGGTHAPFEFTALRTNDPPHGWGSVHRQVNGGAMDGFFKECQNATGDGNDAIGYYTAVELPFYY